MTQATDQHSADVPKSSAFTQRLPKIAAFVGLGIFAVAAWFLHRTLAGLNFADLLTELRSHSPLRLGLAVAFAASGYTVLTANDALAIRYIGRSIPYSRSALTAFMACAVGHNVGIAALSGGSIRYRMYSALGLSAADIARVIVFCTTTFAVGAAFLLGGALALMPAQELALLGLPNELLRTLGTVLLLCAAGYVALPLLMRSPVSVASWHIEIPRIGITTAQLAVSVTDLALASATLYVLLEVDIEIGYFAFLGIYLVAISAGLLSNIPGGIGVFEAVLLIAFPDVGREVLLGTIILYRLIYYVAPLAIALAIMAGHEIVMHHRPLRAVGGRIADGLAGIVPQAIGAAIFLTGVVLLVSGSSPAIESRLRIVSELIPQPVLELSHLAGSVIGVGLLILARGLYRRLRSAYRIVVGLLVGGVVVSLVKGLDYEEATILCLALALLWATRDEFYRQGSVLDHRFSVAWVVVILVALVGAFWVGAISYRDIPYSNELWWQFSLDESAPRTLRAMLLASVTAIMFSMAKLIRPAPPQGHLARPEELPLIRRIVDGADEASANAALIGDKRMLFNAAQTAFIMYQISGRSWVALGDPVGPVSEHEALSWQFRELCDRFDGWPAFYQVSEESLPLYIDMGLTLSKLGEDARTALAEFSLEGKARSDLRQARHRAERMGAGFSVVPRAEVPALIPELQAVSDAWLEQKGAAEKGFSLGRFSPEYIANFDCALVTIKDQIVAFANLWPAPAGRELSIDLMRYSADAPKSVMDFLFAELMLWAKAHDYAWFSLGVAPLSGLEDHALAPLWHRVGNLVFQLGEDFYNFEGLRSYKAKFTPVWRPRYLACPGGLVLPRVLLDSARLISGGLAKIVSR